MLGSIVFAATLVMGVSSSWAGKKEDFQDAVNAGERGGCRTLPNNSYSDLRNTCDSIGGPMADYCDGRRGPVGCKAQFTSRALVDRLDREKRKLDELKDKKRKAEDAKSRASSDDEKNRAQADIDAADKEMYAQTKVIEQAERDISDRKTLVSSAIYNIEQCLNYRYAAMNVFGSAIDRMKNESETDEIRNLARTLLGYYQTSKDGHKEVARNYETALSFCKDERL
ncbi:MAG TPA: hypothetical protein VFQ53_27495 [Kofleriaceae bacterium]|nr:hypothetical protein [Kofleriaceae bacterium]